MIMKCQALVDAFNGKYKGSYEEFENSIINFVEMNMKSFSTSPYYFPSCLIKKDLPVLGMTRGKELIIFKKSVIEELMNGNKNYLLAIFHELMHIDQIIQIEKGVSTSNVINYIKDSLLDDYQKHENNRFGIYNKKTFYKTNYNVDSMEIDANIDAILLLKRFFYENNIDYSKEKVVIEKEFNELIDKKNAKRNLENCLTYNSYYLSLDEAFDVAIKFHPEWLEMYPQLNIEYEIIEGKVVKKDEIVYQEYAKDSNICQKIKLELKK